LEIATELLGSPMRTLRAWRQDKIMVSKQTLEFGILIEPTIVPRRLVDRLAYKIYRNARELLKQVLTFHQLKNVKKNRIASRKFDK
jgi:hypothetical protein